MTGERRNDTNRPQAGGSFFQDQSDAVPQQIEPRMYGRYSAMFRVSYPHPLLCGPRGVIRVMPDHPHEGECRDDLPTGETLNYTGPIGPEFPPASGAWDRPLPEIISWNSVLSGTTSGGKNATQPQRFGGICAYDGHLAGVGRVVTDSTWHHFVNVNLVGEQGAQSPYNRGFLSSPAGQAHFEEIKAYYRNLAVWLARPSNITCISTYQFWWLLHTHVIEAVATTSHVGLKKAAPSLLMYIGRHARDVLGRFAGRCQSYSLIIDTIREKLDPEILVQAYPWMNPPGKPERPAADVDVPWLDIQPMLDIALGGALVAINEEFPYTDRTAPKRISEAAIRKAALTGATHGLELARASLTRSMKLLASSSLI